MPATATVTVAFASEAAESGDVSDVPSHVSVYDDASKTTRYATFALDSSHSGLTLGQTINFAANALVFTLNRGAIYTAEIASASSTTVFTLDSGEGSNFAVGDPIDVDGDLTYITAISSDEITVSPALSGTPSANDVVRKLTDAVTDSGLEQFLRGMFDDDVYLEFQTSPATSDNIAGIDPTLLDVSNITFATT